MESLGKRKFGGGLVIFWRKIGVSACLSSCLEFGG